jgi:hypothetical protein
MLSAMVFPVDVSRLIRDGAEKVQSAFLQRIAPAVVDKISLFRRFLKKSLGKSRKHLY